MGISLLHKDQRGITLVELLIAIALTGIITGGITMTIFQVFDMNTRTSSHMTAVRQVQHAGKQVSQDLLQAQHIDTEDDPGTPELLTLNWTDWDDTQHEIDYTLEDMPSGEFKILQRSHSVNGGEPTVTRIAEYIDPAETSVIEDPEDPGAFIFTVTATVGGQSETRVYKVKPRPGSQ